MNYLHSMIPPPPPPPTTCSGLILILHTPNINFVSALFATSRSDLQFCHDSPTPLIYMHTQIFVNPSLAKLHTHTHTHTHSLSL